MKKLKPSYIRLVVLILGLIVLGSLVRISINNRNQKKMSLTSLAFHEGETIPVEYTCYHKNVSPPLTIKNVPASAKSLALIVYDSDANDFIHWTMWNIEPTSEEILTTTPPAGVSQGKNDFAWNGYGGPCPKSGTHHYSFTLYALKKRLDLPGGSPADQVKEKIKKNQFKHVTLTGIYTFEKK